eukprot:TRINITY_DN20399_c0_g1_i2.p1 TRINITY_DN20399_c0_g1~~TRINITY_DN20399_c0_g1_i2.p1  ORF type:complete len:381 (-),score=65.51 TRINITY_DN20399_c0_g1_i2:757-1899(-)
MHSAGLQLRWSAGTMAVLCQTRDPDKCRQPMWGLRTLEHKGRLLRVLRVLDQHHPSTLLRGWYPRSFLLSDREDVRQFAASLPDLTGVLCLKPQQGTEGDGIELISVGQIARYAQQFFLPDFQGGNVSRVHFRYSQYLAQVYLPNPLLLQGRKFDFRVHCFSALTIAEVGGRLVPRLWAFFFPAPLAKLASGSFHLAGATIPEHKRRHVLNAEPGTKWLGPAELWEMLPELVRARWEGQHQMVGHMMGQVDRALRAVFKATRTMLVQEAVSKAVFGRSVLVDPTQRELRIARQKLGPVKWELYGVDFVVDTSFDSWMLDFNAGPGLTKAKSLGDLVGNQFREMQLILQSVAERGHPRYEIGGRECVAEQEYRHQCVYLDS